MGIHRKGAKDAKNREEETGINPRVLLCIARFPVHLSSSFTMIYFAIFAPSRFIFLGGVLA
jgi:hypothetical protein